MLKPTFLLLCLPLFAACSTVNEPKQAQVIIEQKLVVHKPAAPLMELCVARETHEIVVTGDIIDEKDAWKASFYECAGRMESLVNWLNKAPE